MNLNREDQSYQCLGYVEPQPVTSIDTNTDCFEEMKTLRLKYSKNVIVGYININSVRNKFEHFSQMIRDKLDVLIIAETKLDPSFPSSQFTINGFNAPIRLDITRNSGGLLVYSREDILCRKIEGLEIPKDIQAIPIEINIRKQKWLLLPIYRSPTQDPCYFVDNVCRIIDGYALSRENVLLIGDFNMEVGDRALSPLINTYHLFNLLKGPTCFKTSRGRSIDLILTNKKHSFMKSQSFETGFSDHHHLIYTILKSTFVKLPPRNIRYREYRNFCAEEFQRDLDIKLRDTIPTDYQALHSVTESVLQKHAPLKQRMVRGNNKPHVKSDMRKAIMTRTRLKTRANKSGNDEDRKKYKQQRNLIVSMNRKAKRDLYHPVDINAIDNDKKFWKAVKPMFSNGNPMGEKIVLIEEGEVISDDKVIAECLNSHFVNITDSLGLDPSFKDDGIDVSLENKVDIATEKYNNHPSIVAIKSKVQIEKKFEFSNVNLLNVMIKIEALDNSKSKSGNIPTKIIQEAKEVICPYLTDCINATMDNCCFPDKLKEADVCAIHKKDDTCQKVNFRPISVLSAMSKIFERIMSEQINQFFVGILSSLLSGFRQGYSTQHALFRVVETWKKCLDMSGIVGTIPMDLSKAYDCIPHDLLIAKLEAYGFKKNAVKLV